jgi:uncharacterized protein YaiI (UPF0178 family)
MGVLTTVFVDAENVRRSIWPNVPPARLVELCDAWAREQGLHAVVVFDGPAPNAGGEHCTVIGAGAESADDWIARSAQTTDDFWLVTSDRELRQRAGARAERTIGGGAFVRALAS